MPRIVKRLVTILSRLCLLSALTIFYLWLYYNSPTASEGSTQLVNILPGMGLKAIATTLEQARVIRHRWMFILYVAVLHRGAYLQAGEYALRATMSPTQIVHVLRSGRVVHHALTIPEGLTVRDMATLVAVKGLGDRQVLLDLASDHAFIASLGLAVTSLEGYLFPNTYHVPRGIRERDLLRLMVHTLQENYPPEIAVQAQRLGLSQHEVLTLASLIEKEAQLEAERPLIAAVYHNRLQRGMRLQCDPTVIYALGERFDGNLRKADLDLDSPYNTYRYPGLPPGPIANPGRQAIDAAVAPAPVDYLYFVATGNGAHQFSRTLPEHNQAVEKYQLNSKHSP
jgi:UPF0755 protein